MKIKLLKNTLLVISLIVCTISFGQIDYTFDANLEDWRRGTNGGGATNSAVVWDAGTAPNTGIFNVATNATSTTSLAIRTNAGVTIDADANKFIRIVIQNQSEATGFRFNNTNGNITLFGVLEAGSVNSGFQTIDIDFSAETNWIGVNAVTILIRDFTAGALGDSSVNIDQISFSSTTLSNPENTLLDVNVFPNPTSDFINIKNFKGSNMDIFNITGTKVKSATIDTENFRANVSDLSAGVYYVKLISEGKTATKKLVIE